MIIPRYKKVLGRVCSMCPPGGGGETYDAAYNAGTLALSEEQQDWAREQYNWYKHGGSSYERTLVSEGERVWVPGTPSLDSTRHGTADGSAYAPATEGHWETSDPVYEETWVPDPDAYSFRDMEEDQIKYNGEEIASALSLLPQQTELTGMQLDDAMTHIGERAPVRQEFYDQALGGVDTERRASMAAADAAHAFMNSDSISRRSSARAGINPDSGRYAAMSTARATDRARAVGTAATMARTGAEQENFSRLNAAMGYGGA